MKLLNRFRAITFIFLIVSSVQCSKYLGETEEFVIDVPGSGTEVVPASGSTATAQLVGAYTSNKNIMTGILSWSGLSGPPTAIHFHGAAAKGKNINVALTTLLKIPGSTAGQMNFEAAFTESQENTVIGGLLYFDIHTAAKPNGEVRGQIILK